MLIVGKPDKISIYSSFDSVSLKVNCLLVFLDHPNYSRSIYGLFLSHLDLLVSQTNQIFNLSKPSFYLNDVCLLLCKQFLFCATQASNSQVVASKELWRVANSFSLASHSNILRSNHRLHSRFYLLHLCTPRVTELGVFVESSTNGQHVVDKLHTGKDTKYFERHSCSVMLTICSLQIIH